MNDPHKPVPPARHAPDIVERRFDGAEQPNRHKDQRHGADQAKGAAVNVADERPDRLHHLLAGLVLAMSGAENQRGQLVRQLLDKLGPALFGGLREARQQFLDLFGDLASVARAGFLAGGCPWNQFGGQLVDQVGALLATALHQPGQRGSDFFHNPTPGRLLFLGRRRNQAQLGRQFVHDRLNQFGLLVFAALKQFGGHAQSHCQQRDQRQQRRVGQRRGAHWTAVAHKALSHQHPEMDEPS